MLAGLRWKKQASQVATVAEGRARWSSQPTRPWQTGLINSHNSAELWHQTQDFTKLEISNEIAGRDKPGERRGESLNQGTAHSRQRIMLNPSLIRTGWISPCSGHVESVPAPDTLDPSLLRTSWVRPCRKGWISHLKLT